MFRPDSLELGLLQRSCVPFLTASPLSSALQTLFALMAVCTAFQQARFSAPRFATAVRSSIADPVPEYVPPPAKKEIPAKWFPFGGMKAPILLDGSMAGDVGFDPLGFSGSMKTLYWMRECEITHGRLAMLGAVGWPISELYHKSIASALGWDSILVSGNRVPSLLNGGLSQGYASAALMSAIAIAGFLESKRMNDGAIFWNNEKPAGYEPGNFNFDPLGLGKKGGARMRECEIKNGRLAMLAVTTMAFAEFLTKEAVTELTPFLF